MIRAHLKQFFEKINFFSSPPANTLAVKNLVRFRGWSSVSAAARWQRRGCHPPIRSRRKQRAGFSDFSE